MPRLSDIALGDSAFNDGRWFNWKFGVRVRIRCAIDSGFQERVDELQEQHRVVLDNLPRSKEAGDLRYATQAQAVAERLLVDWNLDQDDGTPIAYTPAEGTRVLRDPKFQPLYLFVLQHAAADHFMGRDPDPLERFDGSVNGALSTASTSKRTSADSSAARSLDLSPTSQT